jgi:hypothetical protein
VGAVAANVGEIEIEGKPYYLHLTGTDYRLHGFDARKAEVKVDDIPLDGGGYCSQGRQGRTSPAASRVRRTCPVTTAWPDCLCRR